MVGDFHMLAAFFITFYHKVQDVFGVGVMKSGKPVEVGTFKEGIESADKEALLSIMKEHFHKEVDSVLYIKPGIIVELKITSYENEKLVEPVFHQFLFNKTLADCSFEQLLKIPVEITNPDKPLFPESSITKIDYINYLQRVSPFLLPFLKNRLLTTIRYPHGLFGDFFYQKQCPDYAPSFVDTFYHEDIKYIVCNNIETLLWLGNQLAFELHIPFETIHSESMPSEIVFDLDPASVDKFSSAIIAAKLLKQILDQLHLHSFVKISGNKGIQVYIPLPEKTYSYEEVRVFTEFVARFMIQSEPTLFTVERLKKNRNNRLYIDYIQHSEGKTIISPYSIRGNAGGYVACPIHWNELTDSLTPAQFSMKEVAFRLEKGINPFHDYFRIKDDQPFQPVLDGLKANSQRL